MNDDFDLETELNRKCGEALSWLHNERDRGAISEEAFQTALLIFDLSTLGLVDKDWSDWTTEQRTTMQMHHAYKDKVVLREVGSTKPRNIVLELKRKEGEIKMTVLLSNHFTVKTHTFEKATDPCRAAKDRYPVLIQELISRNFTVIS